jgi:hypothetical protein
MQRPRRGTPRQSTERTGEGPDPEAVRRFVSGKSSPAECRLVVRQLLRLRPSEKPPRSAP